MFSTLQIGSALAVAATVAGALLWQRGEIHQARAALADERTAHVDTKRRHAEALGIQSATINGLLSDALRVQGLLQAAEGERDRRFAKELQDAIATDRLRRDSPATRVRINAACPAPAAAASAPVVPGVPATSSVVVAPAEIVGPDRQRVLDLVGAVKEEDVQMRYLIEYAQACAAARK